jgi:hypothetical protein
LQVALNRFKVLFNKHKNNVECHLVDLTNINYAQRERLAFIDFCLQFFGQISRADLVNHFKTGLASCSRDLTLYRELASDNLTLKHETKQYYRTSEFTPVFEHNPEATLNSLCRGFGDGFSNGITPSDVCIDATRLIHPSSDVIASILRAINNRQAISCDYVSLSSGETKRTIVPHSLANNGQRWHVRAFDKKNKAFRDFVCTRIHNVAVIEKPIATIQGREFDKQWNNIHKITLVPHPSIKHFKAIELDYAMVGGKIELNVREALLGYLMRQWNVDCSLESTLVGEQHQLRLDNINELQGIDSLSIAPGYNILKD